MVTPPTPRPRRRSQAERSSETREKVIGAAITCLNRAGYSATTITTVAEEAKVSRGAMTHQFPAKTDLMLAVVQSVFEDDARLYRAYAASLTDPDAWLDGLPTVMWDVISRPSGIAVMEIMLASRSDPELAEKLRTIQGRIDVRAHHWVEGRIRAAGWAPHADQDAIHEVFVAAIRGLAVRATFRNDDTGVHGSLKVLAEMARRFYPPAKE